MREKLIEIDGSIWYSTSHKTHWDQSPGGMSQYQLSTQKIIHTIEYPPNINPQRQVCCKYKDKIYIIDGEHGEIILFDPIKKTFTKKLLIPKIGCYPNAVVVFNKIHIINGRNNDQHHLVYDPITNQLIDDKIAVDKITCGAALVYENKIIAFGGYYNTKGSRSDNFMITTPIGNYALVVKLRFPSRVFKLA